MAPPAGQLSALLDGDDAANGVDEASERLERAEIARAQAESDAAEGKRRLEVARQQFAEYAVAKADEASAMGAKIRELLDLVAGADARVAKGMAELAELATSAKAEASAGNQHVVMQKPVEGGSGIGKELVHRTSVKARLLAPSGGRVTPGTWR